MKQNEKQSSDRYKEYMTYAYSMDDVEDNQRLSESEAELIYEDGEEFWDDDRTASDDISDAEEEVLLEEIDITEAMYSLGNDFKEADPVRLYMNEIGKVPLLSKEEEKELAVKAADGDEAAKDKLVQANLRYVVYIAKRYKNKGMAFLDLIQEGNLGLIEAVKRFDPAKGFRLSTYAKFWIKKYMLEALGDNIEEQKNISFNMTIGDEKETELEDIWQNPHEYPVDDTIMDNQMHLDMSEIGECLKKLPCDDPRDKLVLHIITNQFSERSINTLLKKAGMPKDEFEKRRHRFYVKIKKSIRQGNYYMDKSDEEELHDYEKELKRLASGDTTKMLKKQKRLVEDLYDDREQELYVSGACWQMDPGSFFGSEREERFLKQMEKIQNVPCRNYVIRYLKDKYNTEDETLCLKYLKADFKRSGIKVSKPKEYYDGLLNDLNEAKLNDMALATRMDIEMYSIFRKKVIQCTEADFANKEYIYMYFTLMYAATCGIFNYKDAYDRLKALYDGLQVNETMELVMENMHDASRIIGNEILYYIENENQLKAEYIDLLFVKRIPKLEEIIKRTELIKKKKLIRSSEDLFHNQWKELRENIVQYDGNEIQYEYNMKKAERLGQTLFEVTSTVDIDRPYIRRTLYGVMEPDVDDICQIGKPDCFLNSEEYLNTLIYDNNIITTFAKKPAKTKRNLLLTLLFANYCYKILNSTMIGDDREDRLVFFEDKVYREFSACGYLSLNNVNAYDVFLKLLLTCAQPLELYRYLWMKKLNQPMWDYCIDDPDRYMNHVRKDRH